MKTKLNIRRGSFSWKRQADLSYGEGWALANGFRNVDRTNQFEFSFGAYGWTKVRVWANHLEDAFEIAVEWLDDNAPGHLTNLTREEWIKAASEAGFDADTEDDSEQEAIREIAEADLTIIGHTTLKHGQYVVSHECHMREITR